MADVYAHPHRRRDPLTGEWTLVAHGRTGRPWSGQTEHAPPESQPRYDPDCYLCPGNVRAGGTRNPDYRDTYVFTNDFATLLPDTPEIHVSAGDLIRAETERGTCRVVCYSPRHDLTLATIGRAGIEATIELWADQVAELSGGYRSVQVFENRGSEMGASNPHPHGQIWAGTALPARLELEEGNQRAHFDATGRSLLVEYVTAEAEDGARIVAATDDWVALVPFWARWPFETLVAPRPAVERLPDLAPQQRSSLAECLERLLGGYDRLFDRPFPYSMGWHGAPGTEPSPHWQLHAHFFPPLLGATRRKFMVGYEMLAEAQRDFTPEEAAERLRAAVGQVHRG